MIFVEVTHDESSSKALLRYTDGLNDDMIPSSEKDEHASAVGKSGLGSAHNSLSRGSAKNSLNTPKSSIGSSSMGSMTDFVFLTHHSSKLRTRRMKLAQEYIYATSDLITRGKWLYLLCINAASASVIVGICFHFLVSNLIF